MIDAAAQASPVTDWVSATGQWAGAIAAVFAVVVALNLARRDGVRQNQADFARAKAQASLVMVEGPAFRPDPGTSTETVVGAVVNHGDRAILEVRGEVWEYRADLDQPPRWAGRAQIAPPTERCELFFESTSVPSDVTEVRAARMRWTDADGRQWQVWQTHRGLEGPEPYTGQPPRPHG